MKKVARIFDIAIQEAGLKDDMDIVEYLKMSFKEKKKNDFSKKKKNLK